MFKVSYAKLLEEIISCLVYVLNLKHEMNAIGQSKAKIKNCPVHVKILVRKRWPIKRNIK